MSGLLEQTCSTASRLVPARPPRLAIHERGCRPVGNIEVCQAEMAAPSLVVPAQQSDNIQGRCQVHLRLQLHLLRFMNVTRKKERAPDKGPGAG